MKISVVINTYNADQHLEKVLESVKTFDEIVICDMHSTDETLNIVSKYNCKLIFHERTGIVEPARAYAISEATHDWVLVVDADEVVPTALRDYLYKTISETPNLGGIRIPRKNYLMGRFLHSAYPNYILRLINKNETVWPTTVHAHPQVKNKIVNIPARNKELAFIHLANEPIRVTINKLNTYTEFEIKRQRRLDREYGYLNLIFEPFFKFFHFYIIKKGILDGKPGFIWACEQSYYKFVTITKILEQRVKPSDIDSDLK